MNKLPKITFGRHAKYQLKERNISENEVVNCVIKPDKLVQQLSGRFRVVRKIRRNKNYYLVVVVYEKIKSKIEIITVFYTSKIKKYL